MATQTQIHQDETTFRQYTPTQAQSYAAARSSYHANLYNAIFDHHATTGGAFGTLMDVGCGPGNATRPLAARFDVAYGLDPSPEMINEAKRLNQGQKQTASGKEIEFLVAKAEDLLPSPGSGVGAGGDEWDRGSGVDLLTAGEAVGYLLAYVR